jgi:hypothetical protein
MGIPRATAPPRAKLGLGSFVNVSAGLLRIQECGDSQTEGRIRGEVVEGRHTVVLLLAVIVAAFVVPGVAFVVSSYGSGGLPMIFRPSEPLVDEGVAMVKFCGKQPERETVNRTAAAVLNESRWAFGWWTKHRRGDCVVYYQHSRLSGD